LAVWDYVVFALEQSTQRAMSHFHLPLLATLATFLAILGRFSPTHPVENIEGLGST
jgi:hypothetical protein